jgi:hypothetical protein
VPFRLNGVLPIADVRYVASGHAAVMEPGRGPRRLADTLQRIAPARLPLSHEPPYILKSMPQARSDQSRTLADLGVSPPPLDNTLRDTVAWLVAAGHLTARAAGRLGVL